MSVKPYDVDRASPGAALPPNVAYWRRGQAIVNFGDYLTELLYARLFDGPEKFPDARIHLLGSVIAQNWIQQSIKQGYRRIVYWGCGLRRPVTVAPEARKRMVLVGIRGPLSRDGLGLPVSTPIGDPALLLPRIVSPRRNAAVVDRTLCVPHFLDTTDDATLLAATGADLVLRPNIGASESESLRFIDMLTSARFILAGALHSAVVAHAYGVPFAFFKAARIDVPFKWGDFAASIGYDCEFVPTVRDGLVFHAANRDRASHCSVDGLLDVAPFPLREGVR